MREFSASPREMVGSLWRNRDLIKASAKREVLGRYRGSAMGLLWSFFNPLFMLAVYTVVFSVVFKARWGTGSDSKVEFALILFAGLMMFNLFAECFSRAPSLILSIFGAKNSKLAIILQLQDMPPLVIQQVSS